MRDPKVYCDQKHQQVMCDTTFAHVLQFEWSQPPQILLSARFVNKEYFN